MSDLITTLASDAATGKALGGFIAFACVMAWAILSSKGDD